MVLSPDELAQLYAGYDRGRLEQAVAAGPLQYTREAWIAICAECERRGIAWDRPPASAAAPAARAATAVQVGGLARKRCREAAIACGILVAVGALGVGYLIVDDWNYVRRDTQIFAVVLLVFGFLFLLVKKMWDATAVALWTVGVILALVILSASQVFRTALSANDVAGYAFFIVPVWLELMVIRALTALRAERRAGTA